MTDGSWQRVFTGRNPTEAHLARGLLESAGISSEIRGEALFSARGEIPIPEAMPSVWVPEADAPQAREILKDYYADDTGEHEGDAWTCDRCGERLEPQFTSCWNCGNERQIDSESS